MTFYGHAFRERCRDEISSYLSYVTVYKYSRSIRSRVSAFDFMSPWQHPFQHLMRHSLMQHHSMLPSTYLAVVAVVLVVSWQWNRAVRDTTIGARIAIESAEKVLMLVTDPASELWIRKLNSNVESLFDCYVEGRPRLEAYKKMVERILNNVREGFKVCVVFYGHPVFLFNLHTNLSRLPASKGLVLA